MKGIVQIQELSFLSLSKLTHTSNVPIVSIYASHIVVVVFMLIDNYSIAGRFIYRFCYASRIKIALD